MKYFKISTLYIQYKLFYDEFQGVFHHNLSLKNINEELILIYKGLKMDLIKKHFGARLKELRENKGLNQEQLAEIIGLESRHISRIETGKSFTTIDNIAKIAKALDVDIDTLFKFKHKNSREVLIEEINKYLVSADDSHVEAAFKLIQVLCE